MIELPGMPAAPATSPPPGETVAARTAAISAALFRALAAAPEEIQDRLIMSVLGSALGHVLHCTDPASRDRVLRLVTASALRAMATADALHAPRTEGPLH